MVVPDVQQYRPREIAVARERHFLEGRFGTLCAKIDFVV
jgi:hypothetical protein